MTPAERRRLRAIETNLTATDPAFAARLRALEPPPPFPLGTILSLGFYVVWPFIALVAGPAVALATATAFTAALLAIVVTRRRSRRPTRTAVVRPEG